MGEGTDNRRSVDAMLAAGAAEWRATFDAISDPVCLLDLEGTIVVAVAGLRMAWIGFGDDATGAVRVAASVGRVDGYFDEVRVRCDDTPLGHGPTWSRRSARARG